MTLLEGDGGGTYIGVHVNVEHLLAFFRWGTIAFRYQFSNQNNFRCHTELINYFKF